jgi:type III secretion protein L
MVDRVESVSLNRQQSAGNAATGSVLNARDVKAWQDAFEFLNQAEKQIAEEKTQAEEAASRLYESERARGYEDGKAEATKLVTETTLRVDHYLQSIEPQVAQLAMSVVHRVLGNFDTRDLVAAAAAHAITDLRREKGLTVTVHPDVVDSVSKEFVRLGLSGRIEVTVEGNPSLDPTACIIASDLAVVDASIQTQLAAIATAIGAGRGGTR